MAFKQVGAQFVKIAPGDSVTGYLTSIGTQYFPPKKGQTEGNNVPTFTMQKKDGGIFKINLGMSVVDDVAAGLFKVGFLTRVTKPKEKVTTNSGNQMVEWKIEQDDGDIQGQS